MGAEEWPRRRFLDALREALKYPTHKGNWASEPELERPFVDEQPAVTVAKPAEHSQKAVCDRLR